MNSFKEISLSSNIIAASVFGISIFAGIFQAHLSNTLGKYTVLLNAFAAGTQLATILVDLIPHLTHDHSDGHDHGSAEFYPYVLIGFVFLLLLGLDYLYIKNTTEKKENVQKVKKPQGHAHVHGPHCNHSHAPTKKNTDVLNSSTISASSSKMQSLPNQIDNNAEGHVHAGDHSTCCAQSLNKSKTFSDALIRISAISIHSFFEGFGVASGANSWSLVFGLILHKLLESFNVAFELAKLSFPLPQKVLLFLFYASLTPLAICIKSLSFIKEFPQASLWSNALCLGALLFVVFYETIPHSFKNRDHPYLNMLTIVIGYALSSMAIMFAHSGSTSFPPHAPGNNPNHGHHSHEHHHHGHCKGNCSHHH